TTSAVTNSPVGSYVITNVIGNLVATNYTVSLANGSLTVTGAVLTATANNATRAYGATNPVFTVSYNGFVNGDTTNVLSGAPVLTTSAVTNSPVGSYVITNVIGNLVVTNYTVSLANGSLTVTGAVLMVTANIGITANDKVYDGTMAATISSNNVVLNGVLGGDAVSLSTNGYTANFASAGVGNGIGVTVSGLTLTGASATNYTLAQPVELTANITAKALTITSVPTPVITSIGLTNGVVTLAWNSVASGIYRVQYIDNLNGTGWNDLLPDVTATGLTTTQTNVVGSTAQRFYRIKLFNPGITANNKVYDGTTTATINSNNVVLVGVVGGDTVNLSTNGYTANFVDANVGTGIVVTVSGLSLIGPSATNYTLAQPVDLTANITAAGVTVTGISANNKTYDGTTAATISSNNMILNGILVGDAANVWLSTNGYTANFVSTNAGTGIVVTVSGLTLSGSAATNYTLSQPVGLTANIGAATLTYAANPASMTYGSGVPALSGSVGGFVGTDTLGSATTGTLSFTTAATSSSGVGGYAVNGSGLTANNGNYTFVQALGNATALTINALAVNVTGARPYDGTAAVSAGILTVANKVGSDNVTVASGSGTLAGANIGSEAITSFGTLALGGASAGNYTLAGASGTVSITVSGLTVTNLLALNKNYDGTTNATLNATKAGLAGVLGGDSVTLVASNAVAYFADKNVGTNKPVTVTGLALGGAAAINYALVVPTNVTANITAKALTITSVPTPVITSIGLTNGVVTLAWNSAADGIYRVQYIDNLNGTGWNDLLPDVTATGLTTTQTNVVGSTAQRFYRIKLFNPGITANNKVYDGTTTATINSNNVMLVGVVGGDTVNLSTNGYTANFVNANVGTGIVVTVSGLSLIGPSAANYTLAQPVELTANIMPATLTVSAANMSRTYGLPNSLTVSYNGFVPGEGTNVLTGAPSLSTSATTNSPPGVYPITVGPGTLSAANYTFIFKGGTLTVVALPQLSGVALNGDQFVFNWPTVTGQTYQLQYKDNLAAATWILLGSPVVGTGSPIIVTNGLGASPQRFFRVVISP
ncbi:MAG: YDG domain-containing protein, partial [Verrucomicrobiota bacterium]